MLNRLAVFAAAALASPLASAQTPGGPPALPAGITREQMWPAPTAEDWKRPCLVHWQRTWEDAVAIAQETKRAILVCVNMDGEIASEHYAGVRYRQPEIARLYEPYVCVIASVYRHTPRDHDEQGRRIPCPRFGQVTCGEHIAIEPLLFEKFMDGRRIAPRHIMVELDGSEVYDVFYRWDTQSVFDAITKGSADRKQPVTPIVRGDRPILERVGSHDSADKAATEAAYLAGDAKQRRALIDAALAHADAAPIDLVRLGVYDLDVAMNEASRRALAAARSDAAVDLIADALRVPMQPQERDALVNALDRIGQTSIRAKSLANVNRGLAKRSTAVDVDQWAGALAQAEAAAPEAAGATYAPALDEQARVLQGQDPDAKLALAESFLKQSESADPEFANLLVMDAQNVARDAEALGATGWRVNAVLAVAAFALGDRDEAQQRAEAAVGTLPADANDWNAMAVLALFAQARQKAIATAVIEKKDWPPQWLTDLNAAYSVLARHPFGSDEHVAAHHDFLKWFKAKGQAEQVLDAGLLRFPDSWRLHERLRASILAEQGLDGLEPAYAKLVAAPDASPSLVWFAAYASLVTAEYERREKDPDAALAAYDHAIALFDRALAADAALKDTADTQAALALAGKARLALERNDDAACLELLLASIERRADALATQDGLNLSPADTVRMLRGRLRDAHDDARGARLDAVLATVDPKLLELPAYERVVPPPENSGG